MCAPSFIIQVFIPTRGYFKFIFLSTNLKIADLDWLLGIVLWQKYSFTEGNRPGCLVGIVPRFTVAPSNRPMNSTSQKLRFGRRPRFWFFHSYTMRSFPKLLSLHRTPSVCVPHFCYKKNISLRSCGTIESQRVCVKNAGNAIILARIEKFPFR